MRVLKFGGKSLKKGQPIQNVLEIIEEEGKQGQLVVVVSAIGSSTDQLVQLYDLAVTGQTFQEEFNRFVEYQNSLEHGLHLENTLNELYQVLESLHKLKFRSKKAVVGVLSFGEILSAQIVAHLLNHKNLKSRWADARTLIKVRELNDSVEVDEPTTSQLFKSYFDTVNKDEIIVVTGFIASNEKNETVTLGRNGSNYTATLCAYYLDAEEVQNWTDVNGIYSASPKYVSNANKSFEL